MEAAAQVRDRYLRCFSPSWNENLGWENARFVILDIESTGLDSRTDRIVSVGALSSMHFQLYLDDVFEAFVPIEYNTSAVHVHGITREMAAERGRPEPEVLANFLGYLCDGVIVGHHVRHDVRMLEKACARHFGIETLPNLIVDTMDLTLRLEEMGAATQSPFERKDFSLDGLCQRFGIAPHDRHTALGDAFLTGQVFLKLLKRAQRAGLLRLGQLMQSYEPGVAG